MIALKFNISLNGAGQWQGTRARAGHNTALVTCPDCGGAISLAQHAIGNGGRVMPSLVCPYRDCEFKGVITLEGWCYGESAPGAK